MIDEKKIEEAAIKCADNYWPVDLGMEELCRELFTNGAHWALNEFLKDLWHDASEEPEGYEDWILIWYVDVGFQSLHQVRDFKSWSAFAAKSPAFKWLYINGLLPKEGGEK